MVKRVDNKCRICEKTVSHNNTGFCYRCESCDFDICSDCAKAINDDAEKALKRLDEMAEPLISETLEKHRDNAEECGKYFRGEKEKLVKVFNLLDSEEGRANFDKIAGKILSDLVDSVTQIFTEM